jgi:hypothetical protein
MLHESHSGHDRTSLSQNRFSDEAIEEFFAECLRTCLSKGVSFLRATEIARDFASILPRQA